MSALWTEGPWVAEPDEGGREGGRFRIRGGREGGRVIAYVGSFDEPREACGQDWAGNAKAIAALPQLYAALSNLFMLAELLLCRNDLPPAVSDALANHWRVTEARDALKAAGDPEYGKPLGDAS